MSNSPYYLLEVWNLAIIYGPEQYLYSSKDDAEKDGEKKIEGVHGGGYRVVPLKVRHKSYGRQ